MMEPVLFIFLDGSTWTGEFQPKWQVLKDWIKAPLLHSDFWYKEPDSLPCLPQWDADPALYRVGGKLPQVHFRNFRPAMKQRPKVFGCT